MVKGVTGWGIGRIPTEEDFNILMSGDEHKIWLRREEDRKRDVEDLYNKLDEIIALFKNHKISKRGKSWAKVMKGAAAHNASYYNSHRMAREYFESYFS